MDAAGAMEIKGGSDWRRRTCTSIGDIGHFDFGLWHPGLMRQAHFLFLAQHRPSRLHPSIPQREPSVLSLFFPDSDPCPRALLCPLWLFFNIVVGVRRILPSSHLDHLAGCT